MKKIGCFFFIGFVALLIVGTANAAPITITGYNIQNADISGNGNWFHTYTGAIALTGGSGTWGPAANYTGGTGTLADGVDSTSVSNTHLFSVNNNAVITLFFNDFYSLDSIELWQGDFANGVPGGIEFITASFAGLTETLGGTPFSTPGSSFVNRNDRYSLLGSTLSGVATNQLTLSSISLGNCCFAFSISEIRLDGDLVGSPPNPTIPEPTTMLLFGSGLAGLIGWRYRRTMQK